LGKTMIIASTCLLALWAATPSAQSLTPADARVAAPDFSARDSRGARVKLSGLHGRVVLLDFWATWCTGCKVEIPWYVEFQKKYASRGLRSIGVAMDDEGWSLVKPYLRQHPITYPIVLGAGTLGDAYGITNLPLTLRIDRRGRVAESHLGMVDKADWEAKIQQLLREQPR
jgi:thiol-disulfide isomerase/thioredoxin